MPTIKLTDVASFAVLVAPNHEDGGGDPRYKYKFSSRIQLVEEESSPPCLRLLSAPCGCCQWHECVNNMWYSCRELQKCEQHQEYENFIYQTDRRTPVIIFGKSAEDLDEQVKHPPLEISEDEKEVKTKGTAKDAKIKSHNWNLKDIAIEKLVLILPAKTKFHSPASTGKKDDKGRDIYVLRYRLKLEGEQYIYIKSTSHRKLHQFAHDIAKLLRAERHSTAESAESAEPTESESE